MKKCFICSENLLSSPSEETVKIHVRKSIETHLSCWLGLVDKFKKIRITQTFNGIKKYSKDYTKRKNRSLEIDIRKLNNKIEKLESEVNGLKEGWKYFIKYKKVEELLGE